MPHLNSPNPIPDSEREAAAERARRITVCKARQGRVESQPAPDQPGSVVYIGHGHARVGQTRPMATEADAWDALCEKMALIAPGEVRITSCHFAPKKLGFMPLHGGRELTPLISQSRLEVRELGPENFQVFSIESLRSKDRDAIDAFQVREGDANGPYVFASLSDAAGHLGKCMDRHRVAERDAAREETLNAGRESERRTEGLKPPGFQR